MAMAQQQVYQAYQQNKGTLVPGQTIAVNKYTVQVERYLSQGGFAHVYLVRTAQPVYNTTHHVLKRIAVANDAMLRDVKKEVDIMRILKGHPNIVHLIDAAYHPMANGMYEVFILMEFCAGGGIIDMMNRRLRERLTEAEILQVFTDVLEGVAAMHNLRPPLLHRDLKVENILQSSATSYKLCDFGSAAPVPARPPTSGAEIRALEADLNRHTTLQYRAPEMVDLYLRRPVDEKSDVWALGVLLYKLCYYTTPFEEHGPLAILNVQYRIPPYPTYSSEMNSLIGMMLREHGAQRPTVFEVLKVAHNMRGTKPKFNYNVPAPQPLSPRHATSANMQRLPVLTSGSPPKNAGIQAREKVLEAIAPMRRGRPGASIGGAHEAGISSRPSSRPSSPQKDRRPKEPAGLDADFEAGWRSMQGAQNAPIRGHKSGVVSGSDAWAVRGAQPKPAAAPTGFENDFSERLWNSFEGTPPPPIIAKDSTPSPSALTPASHSQPINIPSSSKQGGSPVLPTRGLAPQKDAFDGLGLSPSGRTAAPTLAEARKLRTGLGGVSGSGTGTSAGSNRAPQPSPAPLNARPAPSPRPSPVPPSESPAWSPPAADAQTPEARFPSLEELDASFSPQPSGPAILPHSMSQPSRLGSMTGSAATNGLKAPLLSQDGVRSAQVTGMAMREAQSKRAVEAAAPSTDNEAKRASTFRRPALSRKHRSTISIKSPSTDLFAQKDAIPDPVSTAAPPSGAPASPRPPPTDWLTGDDASEIKVPGTPVLRESPRKRASYIEKGDGDARRMQSAVVESPPEPPETVKKASYTSHRPPSVDTRAPMPSPSQQSLTENWSPIAISRTTSEKTQSTVTESSEDEGPEEAGGYFPPTASKTEETPKRRHKGRQSSVHDLVDLWGGGATREKKEAPGGVSRTDRKDAQATPRQSQDAARSMAGAFMQGTGAVSNAEKRRSNAFVSPSNQRSASPEHAISPKPESPTETRPSRMTTGSQRPPPLPGLAHGPAPSAVNLVHRGQPSTNSASPSAVPPPAQRSGRPQSMFIFPTSAKADAQKDDVPSPGLQPPSDVKPRAARRTSISDMVQRYEAIGGNSPIASQPSVPTKPVALKVSTSTGSASGAANGRTSPVTSRPTARLGGTSLQAPGPNHEFGDPFKRRPSPTGLPRTSPVLRPEIADAPAGLPPRGAPFRPTPSSSAGLPVPSQPSRKENTPTEESPPTPSSPERPYQGVGKLIDQWQKKTAENDTSKGPVGGRRSGFVARRAGTVNAGATGGR